MPERLADASIGCVDLDQLGRSPATRASLTAISGAVFKRHPAAVRNPTRPTFV
jgi:hypothetical protein